MKSSEVVLRELAKKYHVYAVEMRFFEGPCDVIDWNGEKNWALQWADDLYDFTQELGLDPFYYVGKCHGSTPGWGLLSRHPGKIKAFAALSYLPIVEPPTNTVWVDSVKMR